MEEPQRFEEVEKSQLKYVSRRMLRDQRIVRRERLKLPRRIMWFVLAAVGLSLIVWAVIAFIRSTKPVGPDYSQATAIIEAAHIEVDSALPADYRYSSNPPTSGPHYPRTARSDFYNEPIPDQYVIHNLEHGDVWIAYHPRITEDLREKLKEFKGFRVIITARPANETDIALAAWGRLDAFNLAEGKLDSARIKDFIKRYSNRGPEKIPASQHGRLDFN